MNLDSNQMKTGLVDSLIDWKRMAMDYKVRVEALEKSLDSAKNELLVEGAKRMAVEKAFMALLRSCESLVEIVEGVRGERWEWKGKVRLKDTPEWCAFYVFVRKAEDVDRK